jgi:hypothetical protein
MERNGFGQIKVMNVVMTNADGCCLHASSTAKRDVFNNTAVMLAILNSF